MNIKFDKRIGTNYFSENCGYYHCHQTLLHVIKINLLHENIPPIKLWQQNKIVQKHFISLLLLVLCVIQINFLPYIVNLNADINLFQYSVATSFVLSISWTWANLGSDGYLAEPQREEKKRKQLRGMWVHLCLAFILFCNLLSYYWQHETKADQTWVI